MSVVKTEKTKDLIRLDVSLPKEVIAGKFKNKLNKTAKNSKIKGFRPGKAPITLIKKIQGQEMLLDVIYSEINDEIDGFIKSEGINTFGQPMAVDIKDSISIDVDDIQEFKTSFLMVKEPDVELDDLNFGTELAYYLPLLSKEDMEERIERLRYDIGGYKETEGPTVQKGILEFHGLELEGDDLKEGGLEITFRYPIESIMDEALRQSLTGVSKGHSFDFNINQFSDHEHVQKSRILQLDEEATMEERDYVFRTTVEKIEEPVLAEMDEAFYQTVNPEGTLTSREDLENLFQEVDKNNYRANSNVLLYFDFRKFVDKQFVLDLDKEFYTQYFTQVIKIGKHNIDYHLDQYIEDFKWAWVKNYIDLELGLEVTETDILNGIRQELFSYMRGNSLPDNFLNQYAKEMMADEELVQRKSQELYMMFLADKLKEAYDVKTVFITSEEYQNKVNVLNEELNQEQANLHNHDHPHDHIHTHQEEHEHEDQHDHYEEVENESSTGDDIEKE